LLVEVGATCREPGLSAIEAILLEGSEGDVLRGDLRGGRRKEGKEGEVRGFNILLVARIQLVSRR
jgi:hypothetical protein